jgi:hypothetical protein
LFDVNPIEYVAIWDPKDGRYWYTYASDNKAERRAQIKEQVG